LKNANGVLFSAGNSYFDTTAGGINLAVRDNNLATSSDKWYTSVDLPVTSKIVQTDQASNYVSVDVVFDSDPSTVAKGPALLMTDLDMMMANS
jgi:hypothetical protein